MEIPESLSLRKSTLRPPPYLRPYFGGVVCTPQQLLGFRALFCLVSQDNVCTVNERRTPNTLVLAVYHQVFLQIVKEARELFENDVQAPMKVG